MDKDLAEELARIAEHWRPQVVGELNGQEVKLVKFRGEFVWHHHETQDELFLGVRGSFRIEFRDHVVDVRPGEFVIVPRGVDHRTVADEESSRRETLKPTDTGYTPREDLQHIRLARAAPHSGDATAHAVLTLR